MLNRPERRTFFGPMECATRPELEEVQVRRLRQQLERLQHLPFFNNQFRTKGFRPERLASLKEFAAEVSLVDKNMLVADQDAHPPLGSRLAVTESEVARFETTSGTSGLGQEIYALTTADMETIGSMGGWLLAMQGVEPGDKVAVTLPLGYLSGPWGGHWAARALGCSVYHLGLVPDSIGKLRFLERFSINALFTPTPTYLLRLARTAEEIGLDPRRDLPRFKTAWLAGESYPIEWAEWMQQFWGDVALCEAYGSTQGAFAGTCEYGIVYSGQRGYLHNMDWNVLLEVVDPDTEEPVAEGEWGEAVLTTLMRQATPVVRFRTRDRVRLLPHQGCPCGRQTMAIEAGTIGRYDDMIKVKGMNIWPAAVDATILSNAEVDEYVGTVGVDDQGQEYVRVSIALRPDVDDHHRPGICATLAARLRDLTNVSMDVMEVDRETLPHFEYKARRWTDSRNQDLVRTAAGPSGGGV